MLMILSKELHMTKTDIIRDALRPVFDHYFNEPEKIILSNSHFQQLLDEIEKRPDEDIQQVRESLGKYIMWR